MKSKILASALLIGHLFNTQAQEPSNVQIFGKVGSESRLFLTELPPQGFHNKAIGELLTTYNFNDKLTLHAGVRGQFALSDTHPIGSKNKSKFFINKLGLNYKPIKNLEIMLGTFAEQFSGWNESTLPRNGIHAKKNISIRDAKLILEGQYHIGQPIQPMINDAQTPFYGFSAKNILKLGNNQLITGLNFKDFESEQFIINSLTKYTTKLNNNPLHLTLLGMTNTQSNDDNFGFIIRADYVVGNTTFTAVHPNIGTNATPKEYAPHYSPGTGFKGLGAEITQKIGNFEINLAGTYGVVRNGKDATQIRTTIQKKF